MKRIKINGREIEADDETIRWLVFDTGSQIIENVEKQKETKIEPQKKLCVVCKTEITEAGRWKFCSDKCYEKHYEGKGFLTLRNPEERHQSHKKKKKVCLSCGKKLRGRKTKYCGSRPCHLQSLKDGHARWQRKKLGLVQEPTKTVTKPSTSRPVCKICGGKLPKKKSKYCSDDCVRVKERKKSKAYYDAHKTVKKPVETPETTQKTVNLGVEGEGNQWKKAPETSQNNEYKERRRRFILETTDKLCRYSGYSYDKAHSIASLQWESIQMKRENLTPELRLLQSLASGERGVITGLDLQAIDPNKKFADFASWVAVNQQEIKATLGLTGHFIISNGYIRYEKN